jgi:molybdate transport system regulatory protein
MSEKDEQDFPLDKLQVKKKVWLDFEGQNLMGEGTAHLLEEIVSTESLTAAASALGYSYKYAWTRLQKLTQRTGIPVVITHKGGSGGGGRVELTPWGKKLLEFYRKAEAQ